MKATIKKGLLVLDGERAEIKRLKIETKKIGSVKHFVVKQG